MVILDTVEKHVSESATDPLWSVPGKRLIRRTPSAASVANPGGTLVPGPAAKDSPSYVHLRVTAAATPARTVLAEPVADTTRLPANRAPQSTYVRNPRSRGAQCVHTGPRALQLTALTVTRPTPSPSTPSKGGACCATASSSSTTRAGSCPTAAQSLRTARPAPDGPSRPESASWVLEMRGRRRDAARLAVPSSGGGPDPSAAAPDAAQPVLRADRAVQPHPHDRWSAAGRDHVSEVCRAGSRSGGGHRGPAAPSTSRSISTARAGAGVPR